MQNKFIALKEKVTLSFLCAFVFYITLTPAWGKPFIAQNNGTVVDKETGLIWQKSDSYHTLKKGLNWYEALEYVATQNTQKFAGFNDWRLPTRAELETLWEPERPNRSKDGEPLGISSVFDGKGSYYLWTNDERGLDHAWYFGLGQKENYFNLKDLSDLDQSVKMVRGPK
ncbi:MAG: hypothetical protein COV66_00530 [Nitrospinae bacterium CG11_big_fil_rev_8_21_14_0_20_45_15]|nr:MAG: hypothetical protein COV66_00530 [Nitrospinae bacterium CG11_big_fil_rev_8_21_14_0_20_45_15]